MSKLKTILVLIVTVASTTVWAAETEPAPTDAVLKKFSKARSEEHTSELQSPCNLVCRLLLEKKNIQSYHEFQAALVQRHTGYHDDINVHASQDPQVL